MPDWFKLRFRHRIGYAAGLLSGLLALFLLVSDDHADWHSPGPANSGHQKLQCGDCHRPAEGGVRQQIQANLKHQLGLRKHGSYFRFKPVDNRQCLACHDRPDDRHPVQRFNEPRFAEARQQLHPESCLSCHAEHHGVRLTLQDTGFCRNCHQEFSLKHDTINVTHETLAKQQRWQTCLGCHDFHGNHKMKVPTDLGQSLAPEKIRAYFNRADSPYRGPIIHKAKEKPDEK